MPKYKPNPNRKLYDSATWKAIRQIQLAEHPLCVFCERAGRIVPAEEVDHIIPISKGGDMLDMANVQSLCVPCHSKKTAEDKGGKAKWGCDANGVPLSPTHTWISETA